MFRATLLAAAFLIAGCQIAGPDTSQSEIRDLAVAEARWADAGIDSYSYSLRASCFCVFPHEPFPVVVENGVVVSFGGEPPEFPGQWSEFTIPSLHARIGETLRGDIGDVEARYDAALGYPTFIDSDPYRDAVDDEYRYEITDFRVR